jgi:hypothetical protein
MKGASAIADRAGALRAEPAAQSQAEPLIAGARLRDEFLPAILHGDDEHRAWLTAAVEAFIAGEPVPPPTGKGTKETRIAELEQLVEAARTPAGGWTRATLAEWGVPWPPPRGWKAKLTAQGMSAGTAKTPKAVEGEARQPGAEGMRPDTQVTPSNTPEKG